MADALVIAEADEPDTGYRFSWGIAIAGGVVATAVTFILLTLGAGFGLLLTAMLRTRELRLYFWRAAASISSWSRLSASRSAAILPDGFLVLSSRRNAKKTFAPARTASCPGPSLSS